MRTNSSTQLLVSTFLVASAIYLVMNGQTTVAHGQKKKEFDKRDVKPIATVKANVTQIWSLAFSPNGKVLAGYDGKDDHVRFWDTTTGKQLSEMYVGGAYGNGKIEFSRDGSLLASIQHGGRIPASMKLGDWKKKTEVARIDRMRLPNSLAFTLDGKRLGVVDDDHIYLFDVQNKIAVHRLPHKEGFATQISFSPDGKKAAVTSNLGRYLHIIDCEQGREEKVLEVEPDSKYGSFLWAGWKKDGKTIIALSPLYGVSLWDVASGMKIRQLAKTTNGIDRLVAISPDEKFVVGSNARSIMTLWDISTSKHVTYVDSRRPTFSPDGKLLAIMGSADIRIWDFSVFRTTLDK